MKREAAATREEVKRMVKSSDVRKGSVRKREEEKRERAGSGLRRSYSPRRSADLAECTGKPPSRRRRPSSVRTLDLSTLMVLVAVGVLQVKLPVLADRL